MTRLKDMGQAAEGYPSACLGKAAAALGLPVGEVGRPSEELRPFEWARLGV